MDDLRPIRPRINPPHGAATAAFQVGTDIVPIPVRKSIKRHLGMVPAARPGISIGRPDAVDQHGLEACSSSVRRSAVGPVPEARIGFAAPGHGPWKRRKIPLANYQSLAGRNAMKLQGVVGVENFNPTIRD